MLNRSDILSQRLRSRVVNVPQWGGDVRLIEPSVQNRVAIYQTLHDNNKAVDDYDADQAKPANQRQNLPHVERLNISLVYLIHSIADENDQLLFSMADYAVFEKLPFLITTKLWAEWNQLSEAVSTEAIDVKKKSLPSEPAKALCVPPRPRTRTHSS